MDWLLSAAAVRSRCRGLYELALADSLEHFSVHPERLDACAEFVLDTTREHYASWDEVPYHSRWRHFELGGVERTAALRRGAAAHSREELARTGIDLAFVSVLLDAGAGDAWRYRDPHTGEVLRRSEGLALASLEAFLTGCFSSDDRCPQRVDAAALSRLEEGALARALQVSADNPLPGLRARTRLLRGLGEALSAELVDFGSGNPRPGHLFDLLQRRAHEDRLPASLLLRELLHRFAAAWPHATRVGGVAVGDVGRHRAAGGAGMTAGLVPLHKLSQWLAYSLIEPLQWGGLEVTDLDGLTGLAEYRNGGLFLDAGVLEAKRPELLTETQAVDGEAVVEWRALTVALLDELARHVRERLGMGADALPLAKLLQGGTWSAGRRLAAQRRPHGGAPIRLASDGTVF